jgi:hypothetical protein
VKSVTVPVADKGSDSMDRMDEVNRDVVNSITVADSVSDSKNRAENA